MAIPGTQATANDIIRRALRLIGALASGENPTSAEATDSLVALNEMLDAWNAEKLMIFTLTAQIFPLVPGQQTYQIGLGAPDFNVPRPPRIDYALIQSLNNPAQPLDLPLEMLTDAQWAAIPVKSVTSALPIKFYDDGAFPYRNLNFWPIPNTAVNVSLWGWTALRLFPDLTSILNFPPGYLEALAFNLAPRLAPEFGVQTPPEVAILAQQAIGRIKSFNTTIADIKCDDALVNTTGGQYNFYSDTFVGGGHTTT